MFTEQQLQDEILKILEATSHYLISYQILESLPQALKAELIAVYGAPGKDAGHYYSAATRVSQSCATLMNSHDIDKIWINTCNMLFQVDGQQIAAGNAICAAFRLG